MGCGREEGSRLCVVVRADIGNFRLYLSQYRVMQSVNPRARVAGMATLELPDRMTSTCKKATWLRSVLRVGTVTVRTERSAPVQLTLVTNSALGDVTMQQQAIARIAAILAFTAVSTSAFAQSSEYRRGYEDGFAAGQRAASEDRGHRRDWRVHILQAEYGVRGAVCDAREAVRYQVERNDGVVRVGNELCGDPARGAQKYLRVAYRCGDSDTQRAEAREGQMLRLSCGR
jgi:hypothetical protein